MNPAGYLQLPLPGKGRNGRWTQTANGGFSAASADSLDCAAMRAAINEYDRTRWPRLAMTLAACLASARFSPKHVALH